MERQSLNYEKVASAANAIKHRGKSPSILDICNELKIVEPPAQLSSLLEQWYHNQPEFKRTHDAPLTENIKFRASKIPAKKSELEKSLSLLRATLECTADGIMMVNGHGKVVDWNQKFVDMWRIPQHLMEAGPESLSFDYILNEIQDPQSLVKDVEFLYKNPEWQGELPEILFKDGRIFERYTQPQRIGNQIVGRVYSFRDVTGKRLAEEALRIRQKAIETSSHGIAILDVTKESAPIIYVNHAFERITGFQASDILGQSWQYFFKNDLHQVSIKRIELAIHEEREDKIEFEVLHNPNQIIWCEFSISPVKDANGLVRHYVCFIQDITERREMEQQLLRQATHDTLTGLPNRVLLMDRVEQGIINTHKKQLLMGMLFLDLDHFKMINDSLGHSMGDKLLISVSNRLLLTTKDVDTVARFGGDEFVVVMPEIETKQQAETMAKALLSVIEKPFKIDQHELHITSSIGISIFPNDGQDYESLIKNADLSMYYAKDSGRNAYRIFEPEMNLRVINHVQLANGLNYALKKKEFYLAYQPIMDLKQNKIIGVEALIRWKHPLLGMVPPVDFISIAEESGLIIDIGKWVLEEACNQIIKWRNAGINNLTVAVNISGRQLHQSNLLEVVEQILKKTGVSPHQLELEITESLLIENVVKAVEILTRFKGMGLKLSIDDFGTGYSSLSYLKQFPIDKLKIDQSFIREINNFKNDVAIVRAIINLAHSLNMEVVAEGVETEIQKDFIKREGCEYAQGYFFKRPDTAANLNKYFKSHPELLIK